MLVYQVHSLATLLDTPTLLIQFVIHLNHFDLAILHLFINTQLLVTGSLIAGYFRWQITLNLAITLLGMTHLYQ